MPAHPPRLVEVPPASTGPAKTTPSLSLTPMVLSYPTPESLVCLAGAAPSTRQSGKVKVVSFRWAVDKQLCGAVTDFAGDSHTANAWAADLYRRARDRGHPHAVRILARAWLHVIWRCWQDGTPYDPANHRALQGILTAAG
jgi:transposase